MRRTDWSTWHDGYDDPGSWMARRLEVVRERIRVPVICDWFGGQGFELRWLSEPGPYFGVGVHRFTGVPRPLESGARMFDFVGYDVLGAPEPD